MFPNVVVADLSDVLQGHTLCSADPWVFGPSIYLHLDQLAEYRGAQDFDRPLDLNPAPFHPTSAGQQAIADRVIAAIVSR